MDESGHPDGIGHLQGEAQLCGKGRGKMGNPTLVAGGIGVFHFHRRSQRPDRLFEGAPESFMSILELPVTIL